MRPVAAIGDQQDRIGGIAQIDHVAVRIVHRLDGHVPGHAGLIRLTRERCRPALPPWLDPAGTTRASATATGTARTTGTATSSRAGRRTAEGVQQLRIRIPLLAVVEHVVGAVAVAYPEIAVRRDGENWWAGSSGPPRRRGQWSRVPSDRSGNPADSPWSRFLRP